MVNANIAKLATAKYVIHRLQLNVSNVMMDITLTLTFQFVSNAQLIIAMFASQLMFANNAMLDTI